MAPLCLIGGVLGIVGHRLAPRFLALPPLYLVYFGLSLIGMEWSDQRYLGNNEQAFFAFVYFLAAGLLILLYVVGKFQPDDVPEYRCGPLAVYSALAVLFLLLFGGMWVSRVLQVLGTGTAPDYDAASTLFWTINTLDLGLTVPLGLVSVYLLWTRPKSAFAVQQLFYGFFITMITAVVAMGVVMLASRDPAASVGQFVFFACLALVVYCGYIFVTVKKKGIRD